MTQFVSAADAVSRVPDGCTLAVGGFNGFGAPDALLAALRERFLSSGAPRGLTLMKSVSVGDRGERGVSRIALEGLLRRVVTSHVGLEPAMAKLVEENRVLAYLLPLGTVTDLYRAAASHRPGVLTHVGLETFVDPRQGGGKANALTAAEGEDLVSLLHIDGEDWLFVRTVPVDVCLLRGTYADRKGNIVLSKEAMYGEQLEAAAAAHNHGGTVIVQVEQVLDEDFDPRIVKLHHTLVDYVVTAPPEYHRQGYGYDEYRPEVAGECRAPLETKAAMPLNERKICGRRAALEIRADSLVNLGIGVPEAVAAVAAEEGFSDRITLSIESGVLGGVPLSGLALGGTTNPEAIYKMPDTLNLYDGGVLDLAVLGMAEMDAEGNVNVSKFGGRVIGPGGFIDISQNTGVMLFTGSFTAGGLKTACEDGRLRIVQEGRAQKLVERVEQITFSGSYARRKGQRVLYITERAVFRLAPEGVELIEIAPGMDLERDILAHMGFRPIISPNLREMDKRIFADGRMGLKLK
jgi:propionate CoA-transferase